VKILKGNLTETRYGFPKESDEGKPMNVISERVHSENAVAYMSDELGVHRMSNIGSDFAVSLHCRCELLPSALTSLTVRRPVYTPPNVAKGGCNIFDLGTSKKRHIKKCGYYSAYGELVCE
jgi:cysteine dioxygenase